MSKEYIFSYYIEIENLRHIFLDFVNAFDNVDYNNLLEKF